MKNLLLLAAVLALAAARPETYKETEDFQYSRSSTDEGSKSGYYGAQRGNMGGNFERAHNMDGLAQHQMGTAVKQVEGELGDAAKMKSGDVFTSATSGGMFGSGHYDVSNLQGRNFQENAGSYGAGESQSHSSLSSHQSGYSGQQASSMHNSGYNSISRDSGYRGYQGTKSGHELQSGSLQTAENGHDADYSLGTHGAASTYSSGHSSQSGYNSRTYGSTNANQYDSHSAYGTNPQQRLIYATPVRIYGRPGTRVAIPVGVQTYDATHSASTHGQQTSNSEAEVLYNPDQHVSYKPSTDAKHYESAYGYRKQWEKHDTQPEAITLAMPTESPFPKNSELYEDAQTASHQLHASGYNSQSGQTSRTHNAYNANVKSSSESQIHQSAATSQHTGSSSLTNSAYTGDSTDTANVLNGIDMKPKSYQSSYSYHKSWERQGDPYVIKPVGEAYTTLDSQRLTSASKTNGYSSHQLNQGSHSSNVLEECDCDANGYRRVARSIENQQKIEDLSQQRQTSWSNTEDLGQHTQSSWDKPTHLRLTQAHQQAQVKQEDEKGFGQQVQRNQLSNLEDLGQHAQISWNKPADLRPKYTQGEDFGQEVQKHQWSNLEDLRQQAQGSWDKPADLRQKYTHQQSQIQQEGEDFGQQVQKNQWSNLKDLRRHAQGSWDKPEDLREKYANQQDFAQQEGEDFGQKVQYNQWDTTHLEPQTNLMQNIGHSDQNTLREWPGHISESDRFEKQEQQSRQFKLEWFSLPEIKYDHITHDHIVPEDQQVPTQIVSSYFNHEQQSPPNKWINQAYQELQTDTFGKDSQKDFFNGIESLVQVYKSHDQEMEQQTNKPWENWLYSDQHKNFPTVTQWQEPTIPSSWLSNISNTTKKSPTIVQVVGRGDIGPEENFDDYSYNFDDDTYLKKINSLMETRPISITKEKNISLIAHQVNQGKVSEEKKQTQLYGKDSSINKTESAHSSWGTVYNSNNSRHSHKNHSSQLNKTTEQSQENMASQNQFRLSSKLNSDQQKYKVDEVEFEQINEDIYKNWQQTETDTQTIWGQSLNSVMQKQQDKAETFGVRIKDKQWQSTEKSLLAEPFNIDSAKELGDVSNQNLTQYSIEQMPKELKPLLNSHNIKNIQIPQRTTNIEVPVETTTRRPGFWNNAKNKFISWFKSS